MTWRDRLALWCLRRLVPNGLCSHSALVALAFDSGLSTRDAPALVMRVQTADGKYTIVSLIADPDHIDKTVRQWREWAGQ